MLAPAAPAGRAGSRLQQSRCARCCTRTRVSAWQRCLRLAHPAQALAPACMPYTRKPEEPARRGRTAAGKAARKGICQAQLSKSSRSSATRPRQVICVQRPSAPNAPEHARHRGCSQDAAALQLALPEDSSLASSPSSAVGQPLALWLISCTREALPSFAPMSPPARSAGGCAALVPLRPLSMARAR